MSPKGLAAYYVALSGVGATLVVAVALLSPLPGPAAPVERSVVAVVFVGACVLGLSVAVRPAWYRRLRDGRSHGDGGGPPRPNRPTRGHHPTCVHFASHVLEIGGRTRCAGCTGLGLGAALAAVLMVAHAGLPYGLPLGTPLAAVAIGLGLVAANFVEVAALRGSAPVHLASNVLLVLGFLLIVAGTLEATGNTAYGVLAVVVSVLMVDARIRLSGWRHAEVRKSCGEACAAA